MASAQEVQDEIMGANPPAGHHDTHLYENGPAGLQHTARTAQDKLSHASHEVTLFLEGRALDHEAVQAFLKDPNRKDTTLGHAINAASLARVNHLILVKLAASLKVDISGVK